MNIKSIGKIAAGAAVSGALLLSGAGLTFAQTTTTTGTTYTGTTGTDTSVTGSTTTGSTSVTPGIPNTGAGGDAATNLAVLGVSALVVVGGAAYLARKKYVLG